MNTITSTIADTISEDSKLSLPLELPPRPPSCRSARGGSSTRR